MVVFGQKESIVVGHVWIFFKSLIDHLSRQRRLYLYMNIYIYNLHMNISVTDIYHTIPYIHGQMGQSQIENTVVSTFFITEFTIQK